MALMDDRSVMIDTAVRETEALVSPLEKCYLKVKKSETGCWL
jgi:hypothetical protein